jgi:hypothetical protein
MVKAVSTSVTSVKFYQNIWRNIPENSNLTLGAVKTYNLTYMKAAYSISTNTSDSNALSFI